MLVHYFVGDDRAAHPNVASDNTAGHPFDLTKTRLQTAAPGTYTGAIDVVKKALAQDGMTGCVERHKCVHTEAPY